MDEEATFEARAVLAPRRARRARLALLLPAVALVVIAWAGFSGARPDQATAEIPDPTAAAPSLSVDGSTPAAPELRAQPPAQVVGLAVQRLDDVQPRGLGGDDVIAVAGWYVATAITDCPPLAAIYRDGSLPEMLGGADPWAHCERTGVLYASPPDDDGFWNTGLPAVSVTVVVGVFVPPELEVIDADATEVVVLGRFVDAADGCLARAACRQELLVDHVAWTPGA